MNKFNVGQEVWFYCNPDNLNCPEEGIIYNGVIIGVSVITEKKTNFEVTEESCRVTYIVEVVWDDYHPREDEMFLTEKEAKEYAKTVMVGRIAKINDRLSLFVKLLESLGE